MKTPAIRSAASLVAAGPPLTRLVLAGKMLPLRRQRAVAQRGRLSFEPSDPIVTTRALPPRARALPRFL
ncbi:MAG: hypothetical protein HYV95_06450 [Opitutae bacterium]|nr:hypothetical protein [Opitutae bacterium]